VDLNTWWMLEEINQLLFSLLGSQYFRRMAAANSGLRHTLITQGKTTKRSEHPK
jgi:hypothetical protein